MYKIVKNKYGSVACIVREDGWAIPIAPANTDYINFKREILADEAQLQDADGNVMSADAAKEFIKTLL